MNILLGVTASVAATLTPKICQELKKIGNVKLVYTEKAYKFIDFWKLDQALNGVSTVTLPDFNTSAIFTDGDEWNFDKYKKNTDILHIRLCDWADVFVIAPCTANTLAKLANGISDSLLTNIALAWDFKKSPIIIAPAMNTKMWENPITQKNIGNLIACNSYDENDNEVTSYKFLWPVNKVLACGEEGNGALCDIKEIVEAVNEYKGEDNG